LNTKFVIVTGIGCTLLLLVITAVGILFFLGVVPFTAEEVQEEQPVSVATLAPGFAATQGAVPTLISASEPPLELPDDTSLTELYNQLNPGVVNIQVFINQGFGGQGAGSGFILDETGHIVTNNHVVADADAVTVVFFNGLEAEAEIVGLDDDSDLAVLKVDQLVEGTFPLALGDSDQVAAGEWVIAIGNPFSLGGSITLGIISAIGRSIPSGVTPFAIPQAIQTDAAINPGNSGGPLLNLNGEVIGVNAQILTSGTTLANSGVGFAVPVNVVRRVVPVLIEQGHYEWPWLGVNQPASVNLLLVEANDLPTQQGIYIHEVVPGGPADQAGLEGSTGSTTINGLLIPTGGDVILQVDGEPLTGLDDLLAAIAFSNPGDEMTLTVLRDGDQQQLTATLEARPQQFDQFGQP
jgi:2-alkenal reductase